MTDVSKSMLDFYSRYENETAENLLRKYTSLICISQPTAEFEINQRIEMLRRIFFSRDHGIRPILSYGDHWARIKFDEENEVLFKLTWTGR